jgi:hypothetical protein
MIFILLLFALLTHFPSVLAQGLTAEGVRIAEGEEREMGKSMIFLQTGGSSGAIPPGFSLKRALLGDHPAFSPGMKMEARLHRAFFCRLEDVREEKAGMGLKFRLGTVPYVDRLEGKTTTIPPDY